MYIGQLIFTVIASIVMANGFASEQHALSSEIPTDRKTEQRVVSEWGDDSGDWANDGECDDLRFTGSGAASLMMFSNLKRDSSDCRELFVQGQIELRYPESDSGIRWGDDSSRWANDGECDDPRFKGPGAAWELVETDRYRDASDCQWLFERGQVALLVPMESDGIRWGTDSSPWANDGECDDPRFRGPKTATMLVERDLFRDATDCQALYEEGRIELVDEHEQGTLI